MDRIRETRHDSEAAVSPFESATPLAARLVHQKIQDEADGMTDADLDVLENMLPDEIEHLSQHEELGCAVQLLLHMRTVLRELRAAREVVEAAQGLVQAEIRGPTIAMAVRRAEAAQLQLEAALDAYDVAVKG